MTFQIFSKNLRKMKVFHPLLFAIYPVVFLMSINLGEIPIQESWHALFFASLFSILLWALLICILKDNKKAALIATFLLISFFTYGHVYNFLGQQKVLGGVLKHHRYLISLFAIIILLGSWCVIKKASNLDMVTRVFNTIGLVLVVFPIYQIISFETQSYIQHQKSLKDFEESIGVVASQTKDTSDIYYIILDAYGREDVLQQLFDYDNSGFINELRSLGFYVPKCTTSNYGKTVFSLASTLNMNYLKKLVEKNSPEMSSEEPDMIKFQALIDNNEIRKILKQNGYKIVTFSNGYKWAEWSNVYLSFAYSEEEFNKEINNPVGYINEFDALLIETTAGSLIYDLLALSNLEVNVGNNNQKPGKDYLRRRLKYLRTIYMLDKLEEIPTIIEGPKLIFVHIISPHEPYVISADGTFLSNQRDIIPGYTDQITYLNERILFIVKNIIQESSIQPIIIIQGDHGPPNTEYTPDRLSILNAYYLPNGGNELLYNTITPVNSFRLILDYYFGTQYGLLDDVSYNSTEGATLNFEFVPNSCDREHP